MKHRISSEEDSSKFLLVLKGVVELCVHLWFLTEAFYQQHTKRNCCRKSCHTLVFFHNRNTTTFETSLWTLGCMESSVHRCPPQCQAMWCSSSPEAHLLGQRVGLAQRNSLCWLLGSRGEKGNPTQKLTTSMVSFWQVSGKTRNRISFLFHFSST